MQLRARTLLSWYWCGICDWNMRSYETVWRGCRQLQSWREKCNWKFLNKTSLGGVARIASHNIGAIYRLKIDFFSTNFKEIFRARLTTLLARDIVEKTSVAFQVSRQYCDWWHSQHLENLDDVKSFSIAFLAPRKISIAFLVPFERFCSTYVITCQNTYVICRQALRQVLVLQHVAALRLDVKP